MSNEQGKPQIDLRTEEVVWDLSIMYKGLTDPRLDVDVETYVAMMKRFHETHKGKLAETLGAAMRDLAEIEMLGEKIFVFLGLLHCEDLTNDEVKKKKKSIEVRVTDASGDFMEFFEIELKALPEEVVTAWYAKDKFAEKHRSWIDHRRKERYLSEPEERIMTKFSPFGEDAWSDLHEEWTSAMEFELQGRTMTMEEVLDVLSESKDHAERADALRVLNGGLGGPFARFAAETLWIVAGSGKVEDNLRGYSHPMEHRNRSNRISDASVEALHEVVATVAAPLMRRYYKLKAAHLGMKTLRWSDRNAKMPFADDTKIPFDEGLAITIASFDSFSPTLGNIIRTLVEKKYVHAPVKKGKATGAFNWSSVLPGGVPASYVLLNYLGSGDDVRTTSHEFGHAVHGILAGEARGALMHSAPTAYAETASIFGEMATFRFLKQRMSRQAYLSLLMDKMGEFSNTVVRQIGFSNFERRLHGMDASYATWSDPEKYSVKLLDELWLTTAQELYGTDGDIFTYENAEHLWAYISHFHRPFYVYSYAFGELLVQSLYAKQDEYGDKFEPLYLDALRAGSTKNAVELLQPFGLNPEDREFWVNGVNVSLRSWLEEAEALSREMGITIE